MMSPSHRRVKNDKLFYSCIFMATLLTLVVGKKVEDTPSPTLSPTALPTAAPIRDITDRVDTLDTKPPVSSPTSSPTSLPSLSPSSSPSVSHVPSQQPSDQPSISSFPSQSPTDVPSAVPTLSSMPSAAPVQYARPERVDIRYEPWDELEPEMQDAAMNLDYDNYTWYFYGTNEIEQLTWAELSADQSGNASLLGYDAESWDCWINHFEGYRWIDMGQPFIQTLQWFDGLGWNIASWTGKELPPDTESKIWYELTPEERFSAAQLCYFRRTWNEVEGYGFGDFPIAKPEFRFVHWWALDANMRDVLDTSMKYSQVTWNVLGLNSIESREWVRLSSSEATAAESIGWDQISWDCWSNHFRSYSWDNLVFFGLDFHYAALGWNEFSWDGIKDAPESSKKSWEELDEVEQEHATELCFFEENWDMIDMTPNTGEFPFPKPKSRYVPWNELSDDEKQVAVDSFQYNETTWNAYGVAEIEKKSWEQLTQLQQSDAIRLGFYERTWDCFQNHYKSKRWESINGESRDALSVLGWNEISWDSQIKPQSYENGWSRLSLKEQSVAKLLCFFDGNWPGNDDDVEKGTEPADIKTADTETTAAEEPIEKGTDVIVGEGNAEENPSEEAGIQESSSSSENVDSVVSDVKLEENKGNALISFAVISIPTLLAGALML